MKAYNNDSTLKKKAPKNYWNHRVIKRADQKLKNIPQSYSYGIYEVYYTDDKPHSWTENPVHPIGESWNELFEDWKGMFEAFKKPTLELKDGVLVKGKLFK